MIEVYQIFNILSNSPIVTNFYSKIYILILIIYALDIILVHR